MGNIINRFEKGAIRMEAGSTLNGDVHITGPIYQGAPNAATTENKSTTATPQASHDTARPAAIVGEPQDLFRFVHPALEDEDAWKVHREVEHLARRFGVQEICGHLSQLRNDGKLLLPQCVTTAYNELARMGMPIAQNGFDYKTFAKYYHK